MSEVRGQKTEGGEQRAGELKSEFGRRTADGGKRTESRGYREFGRMNVEGEKGVGGGKGH
jgi:hypothetical protein